MALLEVFFASLLLYMYVFLLTLLLYTSPPPTEVHRPQAPLPVLHHLPGASLCVLSWQTGTWEGSVWTDLTSLQEKQKRQGNTWYLVPHTVAMMLFVVL